jgi:hypothetical protein
MTVAVREFDTQEPIREFKRALEVVRLGFARLGNGGWAAIEHVNFYSVHSTVVRVGGLGELALLRKGDIEFADIQEAIKSTSGWAIEDWT